MRTGLIAFALLAFACFAYAAAPSTPTWPKAFSSTVFVTNVSNPEDSTLYRWFYDSTQKFERRDAVRTFGDFSVWTEEYRNYNAGQEWSVFYLPTGRIECYSRNSTRPMWQPTFANFTYYGQVVVDYAAYNNWGQNNRTIGVFFDYLENSYTREPFQFSVTNEARQEEAWTFVEFDEGPQDPNIFAPAAPIASICAANP